MKIKDACVLMHVHRHIFSVGLTFQIITLFVGRPGARLVLHQEAVHIAACIVIGLYFVVLYGSQFRSCTSPNSFMCPSSDAYPHNTLFDDPPLHVNHHFWALELMWSTGENSNYNSSLLITTCYNILQPATLGPFPATFVPMGIWKFQGLYQYPLKFSPKT